MTSPSCASCWRRDDARDRALLGLRHTLQRGTRSLGGAHGVMGPDEFHERYPVPPREACETTRTQTSWRPDPAGRVSASCQQAAGAASWARIGLTDDEVRRWQEMSRRMFVPFHADSGVIASSRATRTSRDSTGKACAPSTGIPTSRSDPARRRATIRTVTSWPAAQHDAVLPVLRRQAGAALRSARLRVLAGPRAQDDRVFARRTSAHGRR